LPILGFEGRQESLQKSVGQDRVECGGGWTQTPGTHPITLTDSLQGADPRENK